MTSKAAPTDDDAERAKGRIALWLDPEDLRWLQGRCCCAEDASQDELDRCARVRFRSAAALHKAGRTD